MGTISVTRARKNLYKAIEDVNESHEPLHITGKNGSAVLVSETDWSAIEETMCLLSIPGMRGSIKRGLKAPLDECLKKLDW
ncbi:MAG: type II toxin-antitoxin system Phd/YefM family antitoxin [Spirochaetota bacterium]